MAAEKKTGNELRSSMRSLLEQDLMAKAGVRRPPAVAPSSSTPGGEPAAPAPAAAAKPLAAPEDRRLEADVSRLAIAALVVPAERFDPQENLASYGADSIAITELMAQISRFLGVSIAPTTFFEAKHLNELCAILRARHGQDIARHYGPLPSSLATPAPERPVPPATPSVPVVQASAPAPGAANRINEWLGRHGLRQVRPAHQATPGATLAPEGEAVASAQAPVAIIAMAGKFPGSPDLAAFRRHLQQGDDCIVEIPPERWDWRAVWGDPRQGPYCDVKYGGFLDGHDQFDAGFFKLSPREAELMDPQHRLFLETAWQLVESAGLAPGSLAGRKVGVFLGINLLDYVDLANRHGIMEAQQMTGLGHVFCPNRLSFLLDVHGPSEVVDTACSSSLVAIHRGVMAIRHEGCEMAIAGGSNLILTPTQHMMFAKVGMLSRDGRCKSFGAAADGYARAEGVGAVLLKRLDLAERDGDNILAVIRGSVVNHGGTASSLTAPNPGAQASLILEALRQSGVDPRSISLVECHGTGTRLGDPIEIHGLKTAFAQRYQELGLPQPSEPYCGLGSVKSNIGHAETAAGVAGLIKLVLAMQDAQRYRSLHCDTPNPLLDLEGSPFRLLASAWPWPRPVVAGQEQPRRAAISSFGAGGANAHLVLEEYGVAPNQVAGPAGPLVVPLSARSEAALADYARSLLSWLDGRGRGGLARQDFWRLAYTLQTGRDAMVWRLALPVADGEELSRALEDFLAGRGAGQVFFAGQVPRNSDASQAPADPATLPATLPATELATRWVAGSPVDWLAVWSAGRPRRIELPTYPFQHRRYWLPLDAALPRPAGSGGLRARPGQGGGFLLELTGQECFLADHRVQGVPVLPGVAYLELAQGIAEQRNLKDFALRQMIWQQPLRVAAPVTLEIDCRDETAEWPRLEFASRDQAGQRRVHAQVRFGPASPAPGGAPVDLEALRAAYPRRLEPAEIYAHFDAIGIQYGPAHRALASLALGVDAQGRPSVLGELCLPSGGAAGGATSGAEIPGLDAFTLHPSLLDGAFQATLGMALAAGEAPGTALPFALDRVDRFGPLGPCSARMWVRVCQGDSAPGAAVQSLDLELFDASGALRLRLGGFTTRRLEAAAHAAPAGAGTAMDVLVYAPGWASSAVPAAAVSPAARQILLAPGVTAARLAVLGQALPGLECPDLAWPLVTAAEGYEQAATLLLAQLQALVSAPPAGAVRLQLLLEGEADAWAGLGGMLKSARLEFPWLQAQLLRCPAAPLPPEALMDAARQSHYPELRWTAGAWQHPVWQECPAASAAPGLWRDDGVYLITGGAGGIGRLLLDDLRTRAPGARVVLVGRSPLAGELASWLAARQAEGARLEYQSVDLADAQATAALIEELRQRHGAVHGVLHGAGVLQDQGLAGKDAATLARVLAPKVAGARNLDRALGNQPLEFFFLFSSIAGVFGNPGQADYAAANAALDTFAEAREVRRRQGLCQGRTLAIAWPLWQAGGMTMDPAALRLMERTTGLGQLPSEQGLALLHQAPGLAGEAACRLLVLAGEAARLRPWIAGLVEPEALAPVLPAQTPTLAVAAPPSGLLGPLRLELANCASRLLKVERADLDPEVELSEYGFDSIGFTQFANAINDGLGLEITPTLFFECPTLASLAEGLAQRFGTALAARLGVETAAPAPVAAATAIPLAPSLAAPPAAAAPAAPALSTTAGREPLSGAPIAIVALTGVFPGADDPEQFWDNLAAGRDSIREIPAERWDWRAWWGDPATEANRTRIKWGGFMEGLADFDPAFFSLSLPEARAMDPQQRLLLTQTWRLFERAGYGPRSFSGSRTGVFIGIADTGYGRLAAAAGQGVEGYSMTGLAPSLGPNRISYFFNLRGPSVAVETACSSALVAIHRAVESLRAGGCEAAIAGGINTLLLPEAFVGFNKAGMLAPDGRCKPFAASANGYARGEGVGLVLLKPLEAAQRDGDAILGVIRASAENHGGHASSLTAPNPRAQAELICQAWRDAGVDPRSAGYIEAHGTGTPLGDPIEVEALVSAFGELEREAEAARGPLAPQPCGLGSVKSNIGHLELAAGVAGVAKVLLQMAHGRLAATLHCDALNPYLKLAGSRFEIIREAREWTRHRDGAGRELPRRAGVSSFGFGGSNAHLVLEEYLPGQPAPLVSLPDGPALILLSARTVEQLAESARRLAAAVSEAQPLALIAWTLQVARDPMEHRLAFTARDHAQLRERLLAYGEGRAGADNGLHLGQVKPHRDTLALLEGDEEMRRAVASLPARGQHDSLLQLWVRGLVIDWRQLYPERAAWPRLPLPGYPFARQRCWVGEGPSLPTPPAARFSPTPEPALPSRPEPMAAAPEGEAGTPEASREARALAALTAIAARVLEVAPEVLEPDTELGEYGFDSITMTGFANRTNEELGLNLTPADFFEFATLQRLAGHIAGLAPALPAGAAGAAPASPAGSPASSTPPPAQAAALPADRLSLPWPSGAGEEPIAIVGISGAFPMAPDLESFWANLSQGRDCISEIPADRWDWREIHGDPRQEPGKTHIRWAGFMDGVFDFDPLFFGISPREAKLMDPQQRLLMTHVWKALEDAGHAPRSFAGQAVGLFAATSSSGYRELIGEDTGGEGYVATGAVPSVGPNRVSYLLDWHGPSEPVETACSSSLVALHRAIQAIRQGDCTMAVVGGVNTIITPEAHINFAKAGMLSPDGRCHTFSDQANGYVRGEGVGVIVLCRLSDALRDGDSIYALVRATAVNHGGRANSLTAPNTAAQADLLRTAYARAGVAPDSIGYIEAHGTGTALGDPVEINALKSAFRDLGATGDGHCGIGSVKTNIGHLELAAGMAGILKVLLQMRHRTLVPSLHCARINPYIELAGSPFDLVRETRPWPAPRAADGSSLPRRAGVSSFGFGGVNAHVVLEAWEAREEEAPASPVTGPVLITLSARDETRLAEQARQLCRTLASGQLGEADLADLAWTLQVGREAMKQRLALVVSSLDELQRRLESWLAGDPSTVLTGRAAASQGQAAGSLAEQAQQWVAGASLPPPQTPGRRLHLPTYPFARESFRVGQAGPLMVGQGGVSVAAPVPGKLVPSPDGAALWPLDLDDFYLRDHQVAGEAMLPGAMAVELLRQTWAREQTGTQDTQAAPLTLRQIVWLQPVRAGNLPDCLRIEIDPEHKEQGGQAGRPARLRSGAGPDAPVCVQAIVETAETAAPLAFDPDAVARRCGRSLSPDWLYARYAALGLDYGPAFRVVTALQAGEGEFLAQLALPATAGGGFALHPVLLDGAFQACLGLFAEAAEAGQAALPFVLETLHFLRPTPARLWVHGRLVPGTGAVRRIDLDLADAAGQVCVQVRGFSVRLNKVGPAPVPPVPVQVVQPEAGAAQPATQAFLARLIAEEAELPVDRIDPDAALEVYGIDSIMIHRLTDRLEQHFGTLPRTLFFDYRSLRELAEYFDRQHGARLGAVLGQPAPQARVPAVLEAEDGIAIIGLAGRYPGAEDVDQFWANLAAGRDCIEEVPASRWDHAQYYDPQRGRPGKTNSKWGGFLAGHDCFDPRFFNISPREAGYLDPQERLFLQCAWHTLEDAGYNRAALSRAGAPLNGASVGVFVGVMYEEYQLYGAERTLQGQPLALSGSAASIANRVSYCCNLQGPSLAVDSMCSSSLSALHLACESLRAGSCDMALAGGVNLTLHPNKYLALAQGRFLSSTGRCESFGQGGDGYVPGEGVGAVLLKPLAAAERDGDRIYGVIRASALNHGGKTNGYSVPNPQAQEAVIRRALSRAGLGPEAISYVEAHGTGTSLGDPIEIAALSRAYQGGAARRCVIGSVKSNIGHAESAAGMAGLTKVLLQLQHRQLAPSLHSAQLNPHIDFAATPFVVQQQLQAWPADPAGGPRRAALSSFGAGGSNAHLIIEEYRPSSPAAAAATLPAGVYPFSARDAAALRQVLQQAGAALARLAPADLPGVARTLHFGREAFEARAVVLADSLDELRAGLVALAALEDASGQQAGSTHLSAANAAGLQAWLKGAALDWRDFWSAGRLPVPARLPAYPFARERYWVPGLPLPEAAPALAPAAPELLLAVPAWRAAALPQAAAPTEQQVPMVPGVQLVLVEPGPWYAGYPEVLDALAPVLLDQRSLPLNERYQAYAQSLLALVQTLLREHPGQALRLQVVVPLDGAGVLWEGLAGLLRTASLEHPQLHCQLLALGPDTPEPLEVLRREQRAADVQVRYQAGERRVRRWQLLDEQKAGSLPWRDEGVYLITGGAGGIGLQLAEFLTGQLRNPLIWLVGRSAPGAALSERLAKLPGEVAYRQADIGDAAACQQLVDQLAAVRGGLHGIIHAAGITRDKLLLRKSGEELVAVLHPKVDGAYHLDQASAGQALDCFLLFASVSGALGNPGQGDYACANAWLDAFAQWRNGEVAAGRRQGATLSLDWPYWENGGMRLDARQIESMERFAGAQPLPSALAFAALVPAWQARATGQVLILAGQRQRLTQLLDVDHEPAPPTALPAAASDVPPAPGTAAAEALLPWLQTVLGSVLGLAPEEIAPDQAVERYGVDSVLAMQMIEQLEQELGSLPRTLLFEYPSLDRLAAALLASHGERLAARFPAPAPAADPAAEPAPALPAPSIALPGALSLGQQALWRWQQLHPESPAYNVPMAFGLEAPDLALLEQSCQAVLSAWPLLAGRIAPDEQGEPRWQPRPVPGEWLQLLQPAPGQTAEALVRERAQQVLDLEGEGLLRFELVRGEADILLILVHHLVFDGLSAVLFSRYFWLCHGALKAGRELPPPPEGADYGEYVAWEREYLDSPRGQTDLAYWQADLDETEGAELPLLDLPGERHPPAGSPAQGDSRDWLLPETLVEAARHGAESLGIHLSAFFLGVLHCLLYRVTDSQEWRVGMPVLGRPDRRFEGSVGYFANLLLLRGRAEGSAPAATILAQAHATMTQGLAHGALPFACLAPTLARSSRAAAGMPVQLLFAWQNFFAPQDLSALAGIPVRHLASIRQAGDVPLALEFYGEGQDLRLVAAFDRAHFDPADVEALVGHYLRLVAAVAAQPQLPVAALPWLDPAAQRQVLKTWSGRNQPWPALEGDVLAWIEQQAVLQPDQPALSVDGHQWSYRELLQRADALAGKLLQWGVAPGQPVAVLLYRGSDSIAVLLACLRVGALWVPLSTDAPDRRLAQMLAEMAPALVLAELSSKRRLPVDEVPVLFVDGPGYLDCLPVPTAWPETGPDSPAYMIHTSGSTGLPKGVLVSRRALSLHCAAVIAHYQLTAADRVLQFASHSVDAALEQMLPTLASGACLVMRGEDLWSPPDLARVLAGQEVSVADLPPAYLRDVLLAWRADGTQPPCPRLLIVGGEALTPELVALWRASPLAGARFLNAYGPTEATITATVHEVDAQAGEGALPIGRPLPGGWVYIVDRDGNPVPEGVVGELLIGGPRLALGYRGQPELTAERFQDDPWVPGGRVYRSGDLARFLPGREGLIAFHGRRDEQVKIRGFRIELGEVEAVLRAAGAAEVAVLARPQAEGDPTLVAYVAQGAAPLATELAAQLPDEASLRRWLAERLPVAMCPARYVFLERLPLTGGGKVDRQAMLHLDPEAPVAGEGEVSLDPVQARLASIWCRLLGRTQVGPGDDFFLCGGHSLLLLRLVSALRQEFGQELPMGAFLAAPTLGQQAELLRGVVVPRSARVPVLLKEGGNRPPLFCIHPVGGGVGCYRSLAGLLTGKRPVYGLQSPALADGRAASSLPALAGELLDALKTRQPEGPYHLAGWSMGGVLAYELACQLVAAGDTVASLFLIDAYPPAMLAELGLLPGVGEGESLEAAFAQDFGELEGAGDALLASERERLLGVFRQHMAALAGYQPGPYPGAVTLLNCAGPVAEAASQAWKERVQGRLSVLEVTGDHYSILRAPHVAQLAELLSGCLGDGSLFAK